MARKITIAVCAAVLVGAIALFAAEKAREKSPADKPKDEAKAVGQPVLSKVEGPEQKEGLLDQLIAAYKANDREKMGEIIKKMEQRREGMRKLAKLNKWHQWAHRRIMEKAGPGWQDGWGMAGPGRQGGWGNQMPWGRQQTWGYHRPMRGCACPEQPVVSNVEPSRRDGWGMPGREHRQMRGWDRDGCGPVRRSVSEDGPRAWEDNRPMRGWDGFGPGWGRPQRPGWRHTEPQDWDAADDAPRTDVPPPDWGW
jgi:hypothetical protein